jgi:hypothetical protein
MEKEAAHAVEAGRKRLHEARRALREGPAVQRVAAVAYKAKEVEEEIDGLATVLGGVRERFVAEQILRSERNQDAWTAAATLGRSAGLLALRYILAVVLLVFTAGHRATDLLFLRQPAPVRVALLVVAAGASPAAGRLAPAYLPASRFAPSAASALDARLALAPRARRVLNLLTVASICEYKIIAQLPLLPKPASLAARRAGGGKNLPFQTPPGSKWPSGPVSQTRR